MAILFGLVLLASCAALLAKPLANSCTVIASCLFAVLVAELLLPLLQPAQESELVPEYSEEYWQPTEYGGGNGRPGINIGKKRSPDGEIIYAVRYTIGSDGFRVTPDSYADGARINFFGDSFTFGEGLADDETMAYYVSQFGHYAVKNFGFHGYGAHQSLAILTSARDTSGQTNVFVTAPWNSTRSACKEWWSPGPRFFLEGGVVKQNGLCPDPRTIAQSRLQRIAAASGAYRLVRHVLVDGREQDDDIELYLALIRRMNEISAQRGQGFLVGFINAEPDYFIGTYTNDTIVQMLKARGVRVIDLSLTSAEKDLDRRYYIHPLDRHPSALANRERARLILDAIGHFEK